MWVRWVSLSLSFSSLSLITFLSLSVPFPTLPHPPPSETFLVGQLVYPWNSLLFLSLGRVLLLILKWGGELTPAGKKQAEEYGRTFRCMYPGGEGEYSSLPGSGFLRLHSTYRHDLKVYASDEGRVQMTAAAFTKVCVWTCVWMKLKSFDCS